MYENNITKDRLLIRSRWRKTVGCQRGISRCITAEQAYEKAVVVLGALFPITSRNSDTLPE
jgi:hypothetical protein